MSERLVVIGGDAGGMSAGFHAHILALHGRAQKRPGCGHAPTIFCVELIEPDAFLGGCVEIIIVTQASLFGGLDVFFGKRMDMAVDA